MARKKEEKVVLQGMSEAEKFERDVILSRMASIIFEFGIDKVRKALS